MLRAIGHIAQREFKIRIRKKSFWIMTFLGPVMMSLLLVVPIYFTMDHSKNTRVVLSQFPSEILQKIDTTGEVKYLYNNGLSLIPDSILTIFDAESELRFSEGSIVYNSTNPSASLQKNVCNEIENAFFKSQTEKNQSLVFTSKLIQPKNRGRAVQELLAYVMSISIYFFIFMYGIQIMKGVVEEKSNRIVEVMLCTVKPFSLMMGKIFGIGLVGLVQFLSWSVLALGVERLISSSLDINRASQVDLTNMAFSSKTELVFEAQSYLYVLDSLNLPMMFFAYLLFFIFGFLLYAAYFAIIGSASDIDTDTQQFIMPVTIPVLGTLILSPTIIANPHTFMPKFLSFFPLTSPIAMPIRIAFYNETTNFWIQWALSFGVILTTFVLVVWIASRIYRIAIMTYGTKTSFKQLFLWFFAKD